MSAQQPVIIERLREAIRRIEQRPARREGVVATGLPDVDAALPGGGFRRGALSEIAGERASGKTAVALAAIASLGAGELAAYVDGRGELYPPAAASVGVDLRRLLVVRPGATARAGGDGMAAGLWAAEALLSCGAFAVVVIDVPLARTPAGAEAIARRLVAAAERGGAAGLWLAPAAAAGLRFPAAARIEAARRGSGVVARRIAPVAAGGSGRAA
jgi:protein ImuA